MLRSRKPNAELAELISRLIRYFDGSIIAIIGAVDCWIKTIRSMSLLLRCTGSIASQSEQFIALCTIDLSYHPIMRVSHRSNCSLAPSFQHDEFDAIHTRRTHIREQIISLESQIEIQIRKF